MKDSKYTDIAETWVSILFGVLAIFALKSIFENDSSKIISKQGKKFLLDDDKMQDINGKIENSELSNNHAEIVI